MHLFKVYIIQFLTGMIYIRPWPYGQNSLEYDYIFTHYSKIEQLEHSRSIHIGGVMVSVLASNAIERGLEPALDE
jgi:hypothetical protein